MQAELKNADREFSIQAQAPRQIDPEAPEHGTDVHSSLRVQESGTGSFAIGYTALLACLLVKRHLQVC